MGKLLAKSVLTASAVFFLFAAPSFSQVGGLEGKVTGEDGKPAAGAVIKIERKDIKGNWQLKTNNKGEWMQMGLPAPATFQVSVEVDGQLKDTSPTVRTASRTSVPVNFDLAEAKRKADLLKEAVASGTMELSAAQTKGMSAEDRAALEELLKSRAESLKKNKALNDAFGQGMESLKAGQYQAAVDGLTKASELDPKQDVVWGQLGEAYSQLGATKYVHAAFFAAAILAAFLASRLLTSAWNSLAEWSAAVRLVPALLRYGEGERATLSMVGGVLVGGIVLWQIYSRRNMRDWADEVAIELSRVTWPTREQVTNGTIVVLVASAVATVYVSLLDRLWAFVTTLVYGA